VALERGDLDDDAENHDDAAHHHGLPTAQIIADGQNQESAEQASDLVDGGDEALVDRVVSGLGEVDVEGLGVDDAAHDTLIVAEEQEARRGDDGHGMA